MKKILILILVVFIFSGCTIGKKQVADKVEEDIIPVENRLTKSSFSVVGGLEDLSEIEREMKIEKDKSLWTVFEDNVSGVSFKYPPNVSLKKDELYYLSVEKIRLGNMNESDKRIALENRDLLKAGKYGLDIDWPLAESKRIKEMGDVNAQEFMVLSRVEICDVVFERKIYFFNSDYQIIITLAIPKSDVIKEASRYFKYNKFSCGNEKVWETDLQKEFWDDLKNGKGSKKAQVWFDSFDGIVKEIKLKNIINNVEKIQGRWQSLEDEKSIIEFAGDIKIDFYDGEKENEAKFAFYKDYPITEESKSVIDGEHLIVEDGDDDTFDYKIGKLTGEVLELIYMQKGNTLNYKKIE